MSTSNQSTDAPDEPRTSGVYVYGIVPADVEAEKDAVGVCDGPVSIVKHGDIAALVSEISVDRPLGKPRTSEPTRTCWMARPVWHRCSRFVSGQS